MGMYAGERTLPNSKKVYVVSWGRIPIFLEARNLRKENSVSLTQVHKTPEGTIHTHDSKGAQATIGYKKYCKACGVEVSSSDIVKAYSFDGEEFYPITEEQLDALEQDKGIKLLSSEQDAPLDCDLVLDSYGLMPFAPSEKDLKKYEKLGYSQRKNEKRFAWFVQSLAETNSRYLCKTNFSNRERNSVIQAESGRLLLRTLYFPAEVCDKNQIPVVQATFTEEESMLGKQLVASQQRIVTKEELQDTKDAGFKELVQRIQAGELIQPKPRAVESQDDLELMKQQITLK
jgi:non-homologous end joining protein Ku